MSQITHIKQSIRCFIATLRGRYVCVPVEDMPETLDVKRLYVARDGDKAWLAAMICPCGCSDAVYLNMLADVRPRWSLTEDWLGQPTLSPSIWRTKKCQSHYFMRGGKVIWTEG